MSEKEGRWMGRRKWREKILLCIGKCIVYLPLSKYLPLSSAGAWYRLITPSRSHTMSQQTDKPFLDVIRENVLHFYLGESNLRFISVFNLMIVLVNWLLNTQDSVGNICHRGTLRLSVSWHEFRGLASSHYLSSNCLDFSSYI